MTSSTSRPPRILVGIDGSTTSQNGLRWAQALAEEGGGTVSAVMAWNYPAALMMPVLGAPVLPADQMADSARAKLNVIVDEVLGATSNVERSVVMGSPRSVLREASDDHDLLVVGRTGNGRLRRRWLGSTAAYCVRDAECPVVIVAESTAPEKRITVAVDGSIGSIHALVWALQVPGDHEVLAAYSHDEWELDDLPLDDRFRRDLDARAEEMLAAAVKEAAALAGVDPARLHHQVRQGDPRSTIIDQADPAELLVLGAQGHSGIARWMLGSLADYAVHHAPGSVAIWR